MGDKSPKSTQKQSKQKQTKAVADQQKKSAVEDAKQVANTKAASK